MGNVDTIRDFLVSLGFQVDESGMRKFQSVLTGVTANVLKMGATVEGAALSVVGFTTKIAAGLDKLYWSSQRTGSTVAGMKALTFAAAQTGSSAEAAQGRWKVWRVLFATVRGRRVPEPTWRADARCQRKNARYVCHLYRGGAETEPDAVLPG